jgi:hypothetical protein
MSPISGEVLHTFVLLVVIGSGLEVARDVDGAFQRSLGREGHRNVIAENKR